MKTVFSAMGFGFVLTQTFPSPWPAAEFSPKGLLLQLAFEFPIAIGVSKPLARVSKRAEAIEAREEEER